MVHKSYLRLLCSIHNPGRPLWLDYNLCSGSISFWNRNTRMRSNSPPLHKVANNHQLIPYPCGNLTGQSLIWFRDWESIQLDILLLLWPRSPKLQLCSSSTLKIIVKLKNGIFLWIAINRSCFHWVMFIQITKYTWSSYYSLELQVYLQIAT